MDTLRIPKVNAAEELFAFQCKAHKLPPVTRQFKYASSEGRKFAADFAWEQYRLLVEINGGIWRLGGGAHSRPAKIEADMERHQYAALTGYYVAPFTPNDVTSGHAINWTMRVLQTRGWKKN